MQVLSSFEDVLPKIPYGRDSGLQSYVLFAVARTIMRVTENSGNDSRDYPKSEDDGDPCFNISFIVYNSSRGS